MNKRVLISIILIVTSGIALALTPAGTKIENIASARFHNSDGNMLTVFSEKVFTTVMPVYGFTIKPDGTFEKPGQEIDGVVGKLVNAHFTVTNYGNSPTVISLEALQVFRDDVEEEIQLVAADTSKKPVLGFEGIYHDENENGSVDSNEPLIEEIELETGESARIIAEFVVESVGEEYNSCFLNVIGSDLAGNKDDDNIARVNVREEQLVSASKYLSQEEVVPGTTQSYKIEFTNGYDVDIHWVKLTDYIDFKGLSLDGILFPDSISSNLQFTARFFDGENWSDKLPERDEDIKGFELTFIDVPAKGKITVEFDVIFPSGAKPGNRFNEGTIEYSVLGETRQIETNEVEFVIAPFQLPLIGPLNYPEAAEMTDEDTTISTETVYEGQTVIFLHTVKNGGNVPAVIDLLVGSANFEDADWSFVFYDISGELLKDSDSNGFVDVGIVLPGEEVDVKVEVMVPAGLTGDNDGNTFKFLPETRTGEKANRTIDIIPVLLGADSIEIEKSLISGSLVLPGEEVHYSLSVLNESNRSSGRIVVTDQISDMLSDPFDIEVTTEATVSFENSSRTLIVEFESLDPLESVSISFKCRTMEDLPEGSIIENSASAFGKGTEVVSGTVSSKVYHGRLELIKFVSPSVVELGSELTYRIEISNPSAIATITELKITDDIPEGTKYVIGSTTIDGVSSEPAVTGNRLIFDSLGSLGPGETIIIIYKLKLEEFFGESLKNRVTATGKMFSEEFVSEVETEPVVSEATVLRPMNQGSGIVGRLYLDNNGNGFYDSEDTVPSPTRIFLEDGSFVLSDEEGLFHFERLKPGTHSMKVDIDVTSYEFSTIQDGRSLRNERSFIFQSLPGIYSIIDIPLVTKQVPLESIDIKDPALLKGIDGRSAIISSVISSEIVDGSVDGYIFYPVDGQEFVGSERIPVEIAVPSESSFSLYANDVLIPESQVGQRATDKLQEWLFVKYYNVKLIPGTNSLRVEWKDRNYEDSHEIQIYLSGKPQRIEIVTEPGIITADGITEAVLTISLVDEKGVPSSVGGTLIIEGLEAEEAVEESGGWDGRVLRLENGVATLKLKPRSKAGLLEFTVKYSDLSADASIEYRVEERPPLVTGFTDLQYTLSTGKIALKGSLFGRLNLGDSLLTFRIGEEASGDFDSYLTHGNKSEAGTLASSNKWYFFRFEKGLFNLQLGDYSFDDLADFGLSSRGNGLSSEYHGESLSYSFFANPVFGEVKKEVFRGEGIRGPYYLEESPIQSSETIMVVTRDRDGEVINSELMKSGRDYVLYNSGMLIFSSPVPYFDIDFNPVFIEIEYYVESSLPGDLDLMGRMNYELDEWEFEVAGMVEGLRSGHRFVVLDVSKPISETMQMDMNMQLAFDDGNAGFRTDSSLRFGNEFLDGSLAAHLDREFVAPGSSKESSGFGIDLSLAPKVLGLKILSGYNYDKKTSLGTLSFELLKDFVLGETLLETSLKETLIHRDGNMDNEIRAIMKPVFSGKDFKFRGEVSIGLKNLDPIMGMILGADFGVNETLFAGGDLVFDYSSGEENRLSLSPYLLKRFDEVSLVAREKIEILPSLEFSTVIGFGLNMDHGKFDIEATLAEKLSIGAGYTASFSPDIVDIELLLQANHTLGGTETENFYSIHFGVENREIEDLKLAFDADLKLDGSLSFARMLFESSGEYSGFERLRPAYHMLYSNSPAVETSRFEAQAELAYVPDLRRPLVLLFQADYYSQTREGIKDTEGSLSIDSAFWMDKTMNFSLTGELYLKKSSLYMIGGLRIEKTLMDLLSISGSGYLVLDKSGRLYNRYIVEMGITPLPDTQIYAGYGWGSLEESFIGNLQKNGFYFGMRFKFDDSWFFKKKKEGRLNLYFFEDQNLDQIMETSEKPVPVRVKIGDTEYQSDERGLIEIDLPAGLHTVELIEYPSGMISLVSGPLEISVPESGVRNFYWPFMKSPAYLNVAVFVDSNTSGQFEEGEEYIESFSVSVGEESIFTTSGTLTVPITPGEMKLSLDLASFGEGVSITTGAVDINVELEAGEIESVRFGIAYERRMEVTLFDDLNGNGTRELEEPLLDASGVLTIGGRPFRVNSQTILEGVPSGKSQVVLSMEKGFERLYSRTTEIETVEVDEKGDTRLEIGFAKRSSLNISIIDESGDYLYEVVSLNVDGVEFQVFGFIELVGLVFGEHLVEVIDLPKGYVVSDNFRTVWLEPGSKGDLSISVEKE